MSHNSHNPANTLFPQLLDGFDVNIKNINWDDPKYNILYDKNDPIWNHVKKLGVEELTDGTIGGSGIFDGLMVSVEAHLLKEYKANRITGADYTQAYIALMQSAMGQAVTYVTAAEQQYWASVAARVAAINGIVELENVKLKYEVLKIEAMKGKAEYTLAKQKLAIEDTNYAIAEYQLNNIQPATWQGLLLDNTGKGIANDTALYNLNTVLPTQHAGMVIANNTAQYNLDYILVETWNGLKWDNATKKYNLENIMVATYDGLLLDNQTKQYNLDHILPETKILIMEQGNVQRAHTKIDRRDAGGGISAIDTKSTAYMQNWLHWVQSCAFVRDVHIKAAKIFADTYAVMRTTDDTLSVPPELGPGEADAAMARLKSYLNINESTGWNL